MIILLNLLLWLILVGLIWWLVGLLPLPTVIAQLINVVIIIFLIIVVLSTFGVIGFNLPVIQIPR